MTFTPSPEQSAILSTVLDPSGGNILVNAAAGTGKSTTIEHVIRSIPDRMSKSVLVLSFGKDIIAAMRERLPLDVRDNVVTYNALGHRAVAAHLGKRLKIDGNKTTELMKEEWKWDKLSKYGSFVKRLVGLAKNVGIGALVADEPANWFEQVARHGLTLDSEDADLDEAVEMARRMLSVSTLAAQRAAVLDFDDQLYLPILWKLRFNQYNWVFVDEAQDTNSIQREMVGRLVAPAPNGRLLIAGDVSQAIYGFRGADHDSMFRFRDDFGMRVLPLTVCRRCSKAVVALAQQYETTI